MLASPFARRRRFGVVPAVESMADPLREDGTASRRSATETAARRRRFILTCRALRSFLRLTGIAPAPLRIRPNGLLDSVDFLRNLTSRHYGRPDHGRIDQCIRMDLGRRIVRRRGGRTNAIGAIENPAGEPREPADSRGSRAWTYRRAVFSATCPGAPRRRQSTKKRDA